MSEAEDTAEEIVKTWTLGALKFNKLSDDIQINLYAYYKTAKVFYNKRAEVRIKGSF